MCETTTLISATQTDLHSCWIIYTKSDGKNRLTVTDAKPIMPNTVPTLSIVDPSLVSFPYLLPKPIPNSNSNNSNSNNTHILEGRTYLLPKPIPNNNNNNNSNSNSNNTDILEGRTYLLPRPISSSVLNYNYTGNDEYGENGLYRRINDVNDNDDDDNTEADQSFHKILNLDLQPEEPIPDNPESRKIFQEHKRLCKEYLQVDTELYYAQEFKENLLTEMNPEERAKKKNILKQMNEHGELKELYNSLLQQLEEARNAQRGSMSCGFSSNPTVGGAHQQSSNMNHQQPIQASSHFLADSDGTDESWEIVPSEANA